MSEEAYGRRSRVRIALRATASWALKAAGKVLRTIKLRRMPGRWKRAAVVLFGDPGGRRAADLRDRMHWYFGGRTGGEGPVFDLLLSGRMDGEEEVPGYLEPCLDRPLRGEVLALDEADLDTYDFLLAGRARETARWPLLRRLDRVRTVDPAFQGGTALSSWELAMGRSVDADAREGLLERSLENFRVLKERTEGDEAVWVLGTGPSVEEMYGREVSGGTVIVCNSIVRNTRLLDHLGPAAVCFADEVFHFGPSRYAAAFRRDLLRTVRDHDCFAVTRPEGAALLLRHHPELEERIIAVPAAAPDWTAPGEEDFRVRPTGNILTFYMLPLAAALGETIRIGGSDGRRPEERYFWKHNPTVQYEGLMKTAFEAHPAFFRDRVYTDYYAEHVRLLGRQLEWLEERGHTIESVTHTYVPVLLQRAVSGGQQG
ncbi:MAG: hypothetical protein R6W82_01430 [bacterium]